jgi:copper chaperone
VSVLEFKVDGMHCGGCSGRLKKTLDATDGVRASHVVLETKQVTVDFDPTRINETSIKQAVEDSGFTLIES